MRRVLREDIKFGLKVIDDGEIWTIIECVDLHNVRLVKEGTGLKITLGGHTTECGGVSLLCFHEGCRENTEKDNPVYHIN